SASLVPQIAASVVNRGTMHPAAIANAKPCLCSLPQMAGGSASALSLSRCSGFTRVTARRIAQPPRGDLCHEASTYPVARPGRSSASGPIDNYRVESSSTDDSRLQGALPIRDSCTATEELHLPADFREHRLERCLSGKLS